MAKIKNITAKRKRIPIMERTLQDLEEARADMEKWGALCNPKLDPMDHCWSAYRDAQKEFNRQVAAIQLEIDDHKLAEDLEAHGIDPCVTVEPKGKHSQAKGEDKMPCKNTRAAYRCSCSHYDMVTERVGQIKAMLGS